MKQSTPKHKQHITIKESGNRVSVVKYLMLELNFDFLKEENAYFLSIRSSPMKVMRSESTATQSMPPHDMPHNHTTLELGSEMRMKVTNHQPRARVLF